MYKTIYIYVALIRIVRETLVHVERQGTTTNWGMWHVLHSIASTEQEMKNVGSRFRSWPMKSRRSIHANSRTPVYWSQSYAVRVPLLLFSLPPSRHDIKSHFEQHARELGVPTDRAKETAFVVSCLFFISKPHILNFQGGLDRNSWRFEEAPQNDLMLLCLESHG